MPRTAVIYRCYCADMAAGRVYAVGGGKWLYIRYLQC